MGGSLAAIVASLPVRFPGLRLALLGGARDLPACTLHGVLNPHLSDTDHTGTDTDTVAADSLVSLPLPLIALPSLHLIGAADRVVPPPSSRLLATRFLSPTLLEHDQGHCIP
jgi:pimeloyl-ACP methyl ester carboxylesterase